MNTPLFSTSPAALDDNRTAAPPNEPRHEWPAPVAQAPQDLLFDIFTIFSLIALAYALQRLWRLCPRRPPLVLLFLLLGMAARLAQDGDRASDVVRLSRPLIELSLSAVGFKIGSHLNAEKLLPLLRPMSIFMAVLFATVVCVVSLATLMLFPGAETAPYTLLVGSIAVERSSPAALATIRNMRAAGPLTTATMCAAALQDVVALVGYVSFGALINGLVDSGGFVQPLVGLLELAAGTIVATSVTVLAARFLFAEPVARLLKLPGPQRAGGGESAPALPLPTRVTTLLLAAVIPLVSSLFRTELLLSAVLAGAALNFDSPHVLTAVMEEYDNVTNILLFCFLGYRIVISSYLSALLPAMIIFAARVVGLCVGAHLGAVVGGLPCNAPWHNQVRGLGLITQLAIALALVQRLEEEYPAAGPMARAYGGTALLGLVLGPPAMQWLLTAVGEAGRSTSEEHV